MNRDQLNNKNGNILILSKSKTGTKTHIQKELSKLEQNGYPCCVITYNEYCDNTGSVTRDSGLNLFANMDLKEYMISNEFLSSFLQCLIELNYGVPVPVKEIDAIKSACSGLKTDTEKMPLYEILKVLQDKTEYTDLLTKFARTIDHTVETVKNKKMFFSECSDRTILFANFVHSILLIKNLKLDQCVWIYTDILDYISDNETVMKFIKDLLDEKVLKRVRINYLYFNPAPLLLINTLDISSIKILDSIDDYNSIKNSFSIWSWKWVLLKEIKLK